MSESARPFAAQDGVSLDYCTISGRFDTSPSPRDSTLAGLADYLQAHVRAVPLTRDEYLALTRSEQANAKDGPAIILARFRRPAVRTDDAVETTSGIGLDVDERHVELDDLKARLDGHAAIIYESANSAPEARRWRVLIPYAQPATPEQHERAFEHWSRRIPGVSSASRNPSRLWYTVTQFKRAPRRIFEVIEGQPFDAAAMPQERPSPREAFLRNVAPPAGREGVAEGARNHELARFAASIVKKCASEAELRDDLLELNATYNPPLDDGEVRAMARAKWKKREQFGWVPEAREGRAQVDAVNEDEHLFVEGVYLPFAEAAPTPPTPLVMHWLPRKAVTLFGSHGGTGKSFVGLEVAVRVALGLDVFGCEAEQACAIFYSCEDEMAVLRDRADRIAVELGHRPADLDGALYLLDMTSHEQPELYREGREGGQATPTFVRLFNSAQRVEAGLVVIDNASDVFAASENDRAKVREFMRLLKAPAQELDLAVLLLAHTNKVTAQAKAGEDVQGYSGSTAWHNSARSRWFMAFDKDDPELRLLSLDKSNYGKSGQSVEVRWHEAKRLLLSGAAVGRKPLRELTGIMLEKVAHYEKVGIEMLASHKAPGGGLQGMLRKDVPELRRRRATEVQEFLDMLAREGFLAVGERPRGGRNKATVALFALTPKGRAAAG